MKPVEYTRKQRHQQYIAQVAGIIAGWDWMSNDEARQQMKQINDDAGWSFDLSSEAPGENNYIQVSDVQLPGADLAAAWDLACRWRSGERTE